MARTAIYLDSNAGAPLRPEVVAKLREWLEGQGPAGSSSDSLALLFPNASSIHSHGRRAKKWLAEARERIALSLGEATDPEQLIFTSGGTEANQLAIRSELEPRLDARAATRWITTPVEHDSVLQMREWVEARGGTVTLLPIDPQGRPDISALGELLRAGETALVSLIWVNNETGVITDVEAAARLCAEHRVPLHLDAAQAWGKLPIDLRKINAKWVAFSSHKIGAPSGCGVLWAGRGAKVSPLLRGKQEKGRRGGTENLLGAALMGEAAKALDPSAWAARVGPCRDRIERAVMARVPGARINGEGAPRVAGTMNVSFEGLGGEGLVMALDLAGYSVSSGSACSSGAIEPSHVLLAMGRSKAEATAAIRLSLSDVIEDEVIEGFIGALQSIVARMARPSASANLSTC